MIIVRIMGGLGNQLFQYAVGRSLSLRLGVPLKLDVSFFAGEQRGELFENHSRQLKLTAFQVKHEIATSYDFARLDRRGRIDHFWNRCRNWLGQPPRPSRRVVEKSFNYDPKLFSLSAPVHLAGYWQSFNYFSDVEQILRHDFAFADTAREAHARDFIESIRNQYSSIVAVHIRRGDLVHARDVLKRPELIPLTIPSLKYFRRAMATFDRDAGFLVFSDSAADIEWCRAHLNLDNIHFSESRTDLDDFALMKSCDHIIMSCSSFSWWAAWLNGNPDKRVVAPAPWYQDSANLSHEIADLIPSNWSMMEAVPRG